MTEGCVHRWQLDSSTPASKGTCKLCDAKREFSGGMEYGLDPLEWQRRERRNGAKAVEVEA